MNKKTLKSKALAAHATAPDFTSLMASRESKPNPTFLIDMTRFFPEMAEVAKEQAEEKGETWEGFLFTYRPIGIKHLFSLEELIVFVKRQRPEWPDKQCLEIAGLIACHVDPPARAGASIAENRAMLPSLYCQMFDMNDDMELYLFLAEFAEKSGDFLGKLQQHIQDRKKNSSLPEGQDTSAPSTSA